MMPLAVLLTCLIGAVAAAPEVLVAIAPDQPAPHIYIGDPLILEFRADTDCTVSVEAEIRPEFPGNTILVELGDIRLQANSPHWCTIDSVPDVRGRYFLTTRFKYPEGLPERAGAFCRIDRPGPGSATAAPACAVVDALTPSQRLALITAGIRAVRVDVTGEADYPKVGAALDAPFQVMVRLRQAGPEVCEAAARQWHDRVYCWQLDSGGSTDAFSAMAKALRAGGTRSPIAAVVPDAPTLEVMLDAGLGKTIDAVAVDPAPSGEVVSEVRDAAERAGYERMDIHACIPSPGQDQSGAGPLLARQGLELIASGASLLVFDAGVVAGDDGTLGPAFAYLDSVTHLLANASYVGPLHVEGGATVHVVRARDRWLAVVWCAASEAPHASGEAPHASGEADLASGEADAAIPSENATALELHDARNNPLTCPAPVDGAIVLRAGPEPLFLVGKGGLVLQAAALGEARKEAEAFCNSEDINKYLAKEAVEVVRKATAAEGIKRSDFLNLLQVFPYLETQWHAGPVPRTVAVPALARLARLARALCVAEHERGEPFVEPLQSTLAACGQYQSRYLTGSAGPDNGHERPDWLLDEVSRLMDEAESLAGQGRTIEAGAVGALAEWRAQALEISAKAEPLSAPEKVKPVPEIKKEEPKPAEPPKRPASKKKRTKE
ncbi:MAG: hypothetical protein NTZ09_12290 [Candidatus Hydrogenedentes bacterium]|nr:hypothetical protein [Candidatus Hydrogenedentota bacterium]